MALVMDFDWTQLKSFAAVGEHGSLSAAARATGMSQPTMSRHISSLEQQVGARLLERAVTGVELTAAGAALMAHAQSMADAAGRFSLSAAGRDETLAGSVRITASDAMATYVLPDLLTALRIEEPEIDLEVLASDQTENLLRREADIAVRMYRPTQPDVITRKVGDVRVGMYAAKSYVERRGMPTRFRDVLDHDVIGADRSTALIDGFRQAGLEVNRDFFAFRSDDQVLCWQMVLAGYGIGFAQVQVGDRDPRLVRIEIAGDVGILPVWLTAHSELKTSPRLRRVFDFLAEGLARSCR